MGFESRERRHQESLGDLWLGADTCDRSSLFAYLCNPNPSKFKPFQKGVSELREEGAVQIMYSADEAKRDPLIYALCPYENLVLYPINPRTVANYRKAFQPSRAKSEFVALPLLVPLSRLLTLAFL